jgi:hypothetical protein
MCAREYRRRASGDDRCHDEAVSPRVAVLMPVFNRELYVGQAIESVIAQDFVDFELLIVDDGSTDRTPEILRAWAQRDERIVVITMPENRGISAALNAGLSNARAPYVARLDSDDLMMPRRLAAQAAVLDSQPEVVLVSSAYETMDHSGNYLGTWRGDEPHEVVTYLLNFYNIVGGGGQVMFRRAEVAAEGGYALAYPSSEDYDLWVRLLRKGRIQTLPLIGMKQRDHKARSAVQYASIKRSNWTGIMSESLGRYLARPIRDEEIASLITVWRHDGAIGMAPTAQSTMREAFARFCGEHSDRELRRCARKRTAAMEGWRADFRESGTFRGGVALCGAGRVVESCDCLRSKYLSSSLPSRPLVRLIPRLLKAMQEFLLGQRRPAAGIAPGSRRLGTWRSESWRLGNAADRGNPRPQAFRAPASADRVSLRSLRHSKRTHEIEHSVIPPPPVPATPPTSTARAV